MNFSHFHNRESERGLALPAALILLLVIASATAVLARSATQQLETSKVQQTANELFYVTEGAIQDTIRQILVVPEYWKVLVTTSTKPASYTQYQPGNYASSNGIPTCAGSQCHRDLYPVGGGLLKNLGDVASTGQSVDFSKTIGHQYDYYSTPTADINLNSIDAWTQVERLDRVISPADALGANLSTQGNVLGNAESVRFRITGYASKPLKSRTGVSTIVTVIEVPAV